jgi:tetratricopeptide (TPR) repeat protein
VNSKAPTLIIILIMVTLLVTIFYHISQQSDINYYQANRLFIAGKYQKAIPYYKSSLQANPKKPDVLQELAFSYFWTGKPEKAIELFKRVLAIQPREYDIMQSLADAYSWIGDYANAIAILHNVVDNTEDIQPKIRLAEIYIWDKKPEKARPILEDILAQSPEHTKSKILLARSLYYTGESKEASEVLEELASLEYRDIDSLIAEVYIASEEHDQALISYKQIACIEKDMKQCIEQNVQAVDDPDIKSQLQEIAKDEARHYSYVKEIMDEFV